MFTGETITSIFFRILNFGILIGFLVYVCKRYFLPDIQAHITAKEDLLQALKHERDALKNRIRTLEHQLDNQVELSQEISDKIKRWQEAFAQEQRLQIEERERLKTILIKKARQQSDFIEEARLQHAVFPQALAQTDKELGQQFSNPQAGDEYLQSLLTFMDKGSL